MKHSGIVIFFLLLLSQARAQQNHFIYIQTENKQPFYTMISGRLLSSSSSGYVIVSKLLAGTYDLNIGFPRNEMPSQRITIRVKEKDEGYLLKNFESKSWGLVNMQNGDIVMAEPTVERTAKKVNPNSFADVLGEVVNTPSIGDASVVKQKEVKDSAWKAATAEVKNTEQQNTTVAKIPTAIIKLVSHTDESGQTLVYLDQSDTIRVFIPSSRVAMKANPAPELPETILPVSKDESMTPTGTVKVSSELKDSLTIRVAKDSTAESGEMRKEIIPKKMDTLMVTKPPSPLPTARKDSIDIKVAKEPTVPSGEMIKEIIPKKMDTLTVIKSPSPLPPAEISPVIPINPACPDFATEDDFFKLRKKMAAQKTDENMIVVAKKSFINKCFSTEQISNLSVLFLKDDGKYNFFDAAYPHVSDTGKFDNLVSRLSDEYYITRFKAMLRH